MTDPSAVLEFWIAPGRATPSDVAELLIALSELHRAAGGSGLHFEPTGKTCILEDGRAAAEIRASVAPKGAAVAFSTRIV